MSHLSFCSVFLKTIFLSCNIGEGGIALAEAVHGSAPDIAGKVCIEVGFFSEYFFSFLHAGSLFFPYIALSVNNEDNWKIYSGLGSIS